MTLLARLSARASPRLMQLESKASGARVPLRYTAAMNVYDFDGTLYDGDSTADFLKWCARRYPRILATLPRTGVAAFACVGLHTIDKTRFKGSLYRFLTFVPDVDREVSLFWQARERRICGPCHAAPGDVVISASPEFLLHDVCARRGLTLIASKVDPRTGRTLGPNCSNEEKPKQFRELFPDAEIDAFYSDSRDDDPIAGLARRAYLVNIPKCTLEPWPGKTV